MYSRVRWGIQRVAVVDIDVHFGNGTYEILQDDPRSFFACVHMIHGESNGGFKPDEIKMCCRPISSDKFGEGFFPPSDGCVTINPNAVSIGVFPEGFQKLGKSDQLCGAHGFRTAIQQIIIPKMEIFDPELLIISGMPVVS